DLLPYRKHIGEAAIIVLRPNVAACGNVVKLCCNPHLVADLTHATLDYVAHTELFSDLLEMDSLALVDERRVSRDHEEPAQFRERSADVLCNAVGKILL